uniref:Uncharacterized protein n=1 Tax=Triticum urartu TaxID=4572 RepID=A0A8R7PHY7_TRIUA
MTNDCFLAAKQNRQGLADRVRIVTKYLSRQKKISFPFT